MPDVEPCFSVVIPVRNGENFIQSTLDSVLNQTYQNFNICILENCSEDNTVAIIESAHDPRIQIFPAAKPLGIEDNWRRILDLDLNEFMLILSHDDPLYPDYLQEIVGLIQAEPQASLYSTHFHLINTEGTVIRACQSIPYKESADDFLTAVHRAKREFCGSGFVMRFADYQRVGGFPALPRLLYADAICWYKLAHLSYKVCSPKTLYAFRLHPQSASHNSDLRDFYKACQEYLQTLSQSDYGAAPQNLRLARRYVRNFFNNRHHQVLMSLISSPDPQRLENYRATRKQLQTMSQESALFPIDDLEARIILLAIQAQSPLLQSLLRGMVKALYKAQLKMLYWRMKIRLLTARSA